MIARPSATSPWLLVLAAILGCGGSPHPTGPTSPRGWVAASDANTMLLLRVHARFAPEDAAELGLDGFDDQIADYTPGHDAREREALRAVMRDLEGKMASERDPRVRQDLAILVAATDLAVRTSEVHEAHLVPFWNATGLVFRSTRGLLDEQIAPSRRQAVASRLRKYAGLEGGAPIVDLLKAEIVAGMARPGLAMPSRLEVEKALANNATVRAGIGELLAQFKIQGAEEAHRLLLEQLAAYDDFLRQTVLPRARASFALQPAVYAIGLENFGVTTPPAALAATAHEGFKAIQDEMRLVAAEVARGRGLPSSDYRDVIRALKEEPIGDDKILAHYQARLAEIEAILRREKLVTLPSRAARIRLGTPAENAQSPAPHMNPPRLLGNTGEQGEFVLPLSVPAPAGAPATAAQRMSDFSFPAATWTLTAHEARPGHELQFAAMVEGGVSMARSIYAANSANIEGWGLYAEAILYPFMPPEGKLISLQLRLQRAARAFLDPELQEGKWTFDTARDFLLKEVGLSAALATSEVERYTFRAPGQATSYYFGYLAMLALRREVEAKLGARFQPAAFHDCVLSKGLLPPALLREAVLADCGS